MLEVTQSDSLQKILKHFCPRLRTVFLSNHALASIRVSHQEVFQVNKESETLFKRSTKASPVKFQFLQVKHLKSANDPTIYVSWKPYEHCEKNVKTRSFFPTFGLNTAIYRVNLRIQPKSRKTRIYPILDTFEAVKFFRKNIA